MPKLLEERICELMSFYRLTLGVAESCTGGLIGHRLTNVPGSSAYLVADVVAYAYEAKEGLLGVPHDVLMREGAVSEPVVLAMARGIRSVMRVDIGIAVTGIAGQPEPQLYFERPLSVLLGACFKAGFVLDALEEPAFPPDHPVGKNPLAWNGNYSEIPPVLMARLRRV